MTRVSVCVCECEREKLTTGNTYLTPFPSLSRVLFLEEGYMKQRMRSEDVDAVLHTSGDTSGQEEPVITESTYVSVQNLCLHAVER